MPPTNLDRSAMLGGGTVLRGTMRMRRTMLCLVAAVTALFCLGSSGASAAVRPAAVEVVGTDFSFKMPSTLRAGWTTLTFFNQGIEPHQLQLERLDDGVTPDRFQGALTGSAADDRAAAFRLGSPTGGVNTIAVAGIQRATVMLQPGTYVALCFVSGADGVPHIAKGMIKFFTVVGPLSRATRPKASATIKASDFSFQIPKPFRSSGTFAFENDGPQPHELELLRLNRGVTADQAKGALLAKPGVPPPARPLYGNAGGGGAIRAGATENVTLKLTKGTYIAVCLVPDPASGNSHLALGMLSEFKTS
jgi:hypothetical protein